MGLRRCFSWQFMAFSWISVDFRSSSKFPECAADREVQEELGAAQPRAKIGAPKAFRRRAESFAAFLSRLSMKSERQRLLVASRGFKVALIEA